MSLESEFQSRVLKYLNSIDQCRAENVSGNARQSGRPDINGCYKGRAFKLELKVPDHRNSASRKQNLELRKWAATKCSIGVIYSMKALRTWIAAMQESFTPNRCEYPIQYFVQEENDCESWFWV